MEWTTILKARGDNYLKQQQILILYHSACSHITNSHQYQEILIFQLQQNAQCNMVIVVNKSSSWSVQN